MKRRQYLFIPLAVMVFSPMAHAKDIYVQGKLDCGMWIESRSSNTSAALEHYLVGLLNGLSLGSGVDFWKSRAGEISQDQAFLWMDKYCRDTPLSNPIKGAFSLMNLQTDYEFQQRVNR